MIKRLCIENFQSHYESGFTFSEGVNAIIGESDQGKSSVLRALNWLINNRPLGESFRSHWAKEENKNTIVSIVLDDNIVIQRIKGNKDNLYHLTDKTQKEFKALGSEVPVDIQKALNFSELNIQKQLDAPFLLSESPGEIARFLNQIVNIDNIDASLKKIDSSIRKNKAETIFNEKELKVTEEELKEYEWVLEAEEEFKKIQKQNTTWEKLSDKLIDLSNLIYQFEEIEEVEYDIKKAEKEFSLIQKQLVAFDDLFQEREVLSILIDKFEKENSKIEYDVRAAEKEFVQIQIQKDRIDWDRYAALDNLIRKIEVKYESVTDLKIEIGKSEKRLKQIMPNTCPICGSPIK